MKKVSREEEYQALRSFMKLATQENGGTVSELVRCAVDEVLSPCQRMYVEMYYLRQMPMRDIAREAGVNASTVSRTLARARQRLERCLRYGGRNFGRLLED